MVKKLSMLFLALAIIGPMPLYAAGASAKEPQAASATTDTAGKSSQVPHRRDSMITAAVKAKLLKSSDTSGMKIHVSTQNGIVTLSGTAKSQFEKSRANEIAHSVTGVRAVKDNELTVNG